MKNLFKIFILLILYSLSKNTEGQNSQNLLENLSLTENNMGSMSSAIKTFIESLPDTTDVKDRYCYVDIFYFSEERSNYISLNDIVDTASFSKDYFVKGCFITDFINKNNALGKNYINVFKTVIYDRLLDQSFDFNYNNYRNNSMDNIKSNYLDLCFRQEFYNYICKLYSENVIDFVFAYPTYIHHYEGFIGTTLNFYFALKGNDIFVVYEDSKTGPKLFTIKDFVDNYWNTMTNFKLSE